MRLFLDTVDEAALSALWPMGCFAGVTTNPLILARAGVTAGQAVERCRGIGVERLFLQACGESAAELEADAGRLAALWGGEVWIKIPAAGQGFAAIARLGRSRIRTAATAVLSAGQALLAAEAGADVLIPFVARAEASGTDAAALLGDVGRIARDASARVLAASVKTADHVRLALHSGCWAATVPPDLAAALARCDAADAIVRQFREAGKGGEE